MPGGSPSRFVSQRVLRETQGGGGAKVWAEIMKLSAAPNVVSNLGQGFPDFEGTRLARDTAVNIIQNDVKLNQYSLVPGTARIRKALLDSWNASAPATTGARLSIEENIMVTTSGTEAIYSAFQAIVDPGDEVIVFQPFFPWYIPAVRMAGGIPVCVTLRSPSFAIDFDELRAKFSPRTKAVIFNTPHNPTGHVATAEEIQGLAGLCKEHDAMLISDEVYEHMLFHTADGERRKHHRVAHLDGMADRTLTIGSASKMFSLTGWRVGWIYGPKEIISAIGTCHAYNSYCAPTPLQDGSAAALEEMNANGADSAVLREITGLADQFESNARQLTEALAKINVEAIAPEGGYFLVADVSGTGKTDVEFSRWLATEKGVICVPMSVFHDPAATDIPDNLVRFAICKQPKTIQTAVDAILGASSN